ncbi:phage integrase SAM-like domain-containing protein [Niabella hibiscisoli]|uniref:phage integrase SAM-like domain-containing protein n=1 Tax=Niabella hibiscisoli TaxID=1825928 RepID=UPI00374D48AD
MTYTDMIIEQLEEDGRIGYANIFLYFKSSLNKLLNNQDRKFISFNKDIHERYEKQISNGTSQSTISNYLRTYYRICNLAIKDGLCPKLYHPSNFIQFKPYKRIRTKKRAIKSQFLQPMLSLKLPKDSRLFRSQKGCNSYITHEE